MRLAEKFAAFANSGHTRDLLRGSSTALVLRVLGMLLTYLFNFMVARMFGASAVGAFALATAIITILGMLSRLGLDRAIVRFVAANVASNDTAAAAGEYRRGFWLLLTVGTLISLLLFAGAEIVAVYAFEKPGLTEPLRIAAPGVLLFSLALFNAEALRGLKRIMQFAAIRYVLIYLLAVPALLIVQSVLAPDLSAIAAFVIACGLATLISLAIAWRAFPASSGHAGRPLVSMLVVAGPMLLSNSMGLVISWTDVLMLGRFATESDVGIYSITMKLAFLTSIALNAVNSISTPKFAELYAQRDVDQLAMVMRGTTRLLFFSTVPILVVLILGGRPILELFGAEFGAGYAALVVLIAGQFISVISGPVGNLLQMTGLERQFFVIVSVCAVLNVLLNILLIPEFGIYGAAVASALTLSINNIACVILIHARLGFISLYLPLVNWSRAGAA